MTERTLTWQDDDGRIADLEVPADAAEKLQRGEAAAWFSPAEPRRQTREDALRETGDQLAGLRARRDQIDAERDALVDRFPGLKSVSPDDDD